MTKRKVKVDAFAFSCERSLTWYEDQTKFMLEWYMEYLKKQYAGFKIKKTHHMLCADGLNKKFAMGVTADQVDRHYRYHKKNWKFIVAALSKSGNTFDHTRCLVTISESEKATLCDRARRLLSKPIKFFNEMHELWIRTHAWMLVMVQTVMIQKIYLTSTATHNLKTPLVRILTLCQLQPLMQLLITTLPALVELVRNGLEAASHQLRSHKKRRVSLQNPLMKSVLR